MTKEVRMTNDEDPVARRRSPWRPKAGHPSFVIWRLLLLAMVLLSVSCVPDRLRQANVDEVAVGMSRKQVESILGPPTETDTKDLPVTKTLTYLYHQRSGTVTIVFKDDKVAEKQSTLTR
jgi:outer membrane protein assembly factor BamE (lipoprotein component of BamABCDE complex)